MKNQEKLKNVKTGREYKIILTSLPPYFEGCAFCDRYSSCRKHEFCRPNKGKIRNWKEYRKTQWK